MLFLKNTLHYASLKNARDSTPAITGDIYFKLGPVLVQEAVPLSQDLRLRLLFS